MSIRSENGEEPLSRRHETRLTLLDRLRGLLGLSPASVREDIEDALEETAGDVTPHERALLKNVLGLHDLRVEDAMIPRADIVAISQDSTLREALDVFRDAGHSRLPVYVETLDDPRGMVHIRDFVNYFAICAEKHASSDGAATPKVDFDTPLFQANLLKPVLFVPRSMPALDLLVRMQASHTHLALVIDEYGGTDGLVTIEDIMEMIVGDIEDEHDVAEPPEIEELDNGDFLVDARADLDEATARLGVDFRLEDTPAEVTTIGGLVAWLAGRVPMRGEIIATPVDTHEFEIVDADPRRVGKLRVRARRHP
ncbi:hemolysin family protein [Methylocystis sp. MJC1]|jgi:CBS domain containing-hemolysin-like protein|uniref:hemolysin family protein n=1 Tax=Methylocystis sp. MJC1 TaxID=2654282 RepID=UPI0013EA3ADA|nr:hemolysin family protein [Methylocystis sp. MJC1]MBU6526735.1 HlyC/CorC family transporter [Methylocystis sp. MJC1]UZX13171.1 hemolysin family protein [Methylocystis sp. MJC1]